MRNHKVDSWTFIISHGPNTYVSNRYDSQKQYQFLFSPQKTEFLLEQLSEKF